MHAFNVRNYTGNKVINLHVSTTKGKLLNLHFNYYNFYHEIEMVMMALAIYSFIDDVNEFMHIMNKLKLI